MSTSLTFNGMAELRAQLRNLPAEMTAEASRLVDATANQVAVEVRTAYGQHRRTGRLQGGVVVTHVDQGKYSATALVKSTAPHAWLFENGSQARHTDIGADRGSMPPGHIFGPIAGRARRRLEEQFKALLVRAGFQVAGNG